MNTLKTKIGKAAENDLVERLKSGQQWAFNRLVHLYQDRLLKIAYGITFDHEESLEVVQDVFVSVFNNIADFRQEATLATWLTKITIHHCLNWKRKWMRRFKWHHRSIEKDDDPMLTNEHTNSPNPEQQIREKQMERTVMNAIGKLPEKLRVVLVLNAFEGLSYDQIADTLNIRTGTVSSRLYAARKKLLAELEITPSRGKTDDKTPV